jgi:hypothetical protein
VTASRSIIFAGALLLALAGAVCAANLADHVVFVQGQTLCGRIGAGPVERLSDRAHYEQIDHDGRHWYVLHRSDGRRAWLKILECETTGALRSVGDITDARLQETTAIDRAEFLPDGRLFVVLHVNPSVSAAVAMSYPTGDRTIFLGHTFTPDPSGRHIAYFREPAGESKNAETAELWVDGKKACELPAAQANDIAWTPTGTAVAR